MQAAIRSCTKQDVQILTNTIRQSFLTVAKRFGLNGENAPRHPSNCTADWIERDMSRGVSYFVIDTENGIVGCVALEHASSEVCYLKRLAVLPGHRTRGMGRALVRHALSRAKDLGVRRVGIGMIAQDTELKDWYKRIGFAEGETKAFPHLPFGVTFMSYDLEKGKPKSRSRIWTRRASQAELRDE